MVKDLSLLRYVLYFNYDDELDNPRPDEGLDARCFLTDHEVKLSGGSIDESESDENLDGDGT